MQTAEQQNMNKSANTGNCRLLPLIPFLIFISGLVLIVLGQTIPLKSCREAGSVVMAVGGFMLLCIAFWRNSRQDLLPTESTSLSNFEECGNTPDQTVKQAGLESNEGFKQAEFGPIHHFEVCIPTESSVNEMVPPSYEESVNNNNTESLQDPDVSVGTNGKQGLVNPA